MNRLTKLVTLTLVMAWPLAQTAPAQEAAAQGGPAGQAQLSLDDLRTFTDIFIQVRENYVEELDDHTLLEAAIQGIMAELDQHSNFISAESFRRMDDASRGRYGGIGVDVTFENGRIEVIGAAPGSPAAAAGMLAGDLITAVNGRAVRGRPVRDSMQELRGDPGTEVTVRLRRPGERARDVVLTRAFIPTRSVNSRMLDERFGYFRISHFHEETGEELEAAMRQLAGPDGTRLEGAVLDLRGNGGGVMSAAVAVVDGFLDAGLIMQTEARQADMDMEFTAKPGEWLPGLRLVVLVDGKSASASEVFAGALQDHGRALIVGEQTYGKGSVQSVLALRNGSGLRLTTARYFTPSGKSIDGSGIEPDVPLSGTPEAVLEQALGLLRKRAAG
jgi:carboxyl-terminal processing protease